LDKRRSGEGYEIEVHLFGLKWEDEKNLEKRKIGVERIKFVRMKLRRGGNNV